LESAFEDFVFQHKVRLIETMGTRHVQTNEVLRCGYLNVAFRWVAQLVPGTPLSLIEIGSSAGINLCFDRFGYDYGSWRIPEESGVTLHAEPRGPFTAPDDGAPLPIRDRIGIDFNPIEPDDEESVRWLLALIWPEHHERRKRLLDALEVRRHTSVRSLRGDGASDVGRAIESIADECVPIVFQTHTMNQFDADALLSLQEQLEHAGSRRVVYFLSRHADLTLRRFDQGGVTERLTLGRTDGHGAWFEWLAPPAHEANRTMRYVDVRREDPYLP